MRISHNTVKLRQETFFFCVSFHDHLWIAGLQGKGEGISLTPHFHFHPLHRHLDISQAIIAESLSLHIANSRTWTGKPLVSERKSLTTKLQENFLTPWEKNQ